MLCKQQAVSGMVHNNRQMDNTVSVMIYFLVDYHAGSFTAPPANKGMKAYNVYTKEKWI